MTEGPLDLWSAALATDRRRMHELADPLSRRQLNWKPAPKRWSVGQCLDHLGVSMGLYLDPMEPVIERADRRGGEPYGRGTWMGRLLLGALRKPGRRYLAPPSFQPRGGDLDPDDVRGELDRQIGRLLRAVERCDGLALGEVKIPWPFLRLVELSLAQAFELQVLHLGRHLGQAERVIRADGFPAA
jgi:hypothetical protein